jgi:hypothetical protein
MFRGKIVAMTLFVFVVVVLLSISASASLIGTPYNGWSGTNSFYLNEGGGKILSGTIDWAVYGPGDFPYAGYTPLQGQLTYVYQVHNTGTVGISNYSVDLDNIASQAGAFAIPSIPSGVAPSGITLTVPGNVGWDFDTPEISKNGGDSQGMVFCSPNIPMDFTSSVLDGGGSTIAEPVPSPSNVPIPEPATWLSLLAGLGMVLGVRRIWR